MACYTVVIRIVRHFFFFLLAYTWGRWCTLRKGANDTNESSIRLNFLTIHSIIGQHESNWIIENWKCTGSCYWIWANLTKSSQGFSTITNPIAFRFYRFRSVQNCFGWKMMYRELSFARKTDTHQLIRLAFGNKTINRCKIKTKQREEKSEQVELSGFFPRKDYNFDDFSFHQNFHLIFYLGIYLRLTFDIQFYVPFFSFWKKREKNLLAWHTLRIFATNDTH